MLFRLLSAFLCWIFKTPLYSGGSAPPWKWAEFERWIAHDCAPPLACINKPEQSSHSGGSTVAVYDSYSAKMAMLRRAAEIAELVLRTDFVG